MINYTTPSLTLVVDNIDISAYDIYATLEQGLCKLTKTGDELTVDTETVGEKTNTVITMTLTQEESAKFFYDKPVNAQVNWLVDGRRFATDIKQIPVMRNLLNRVIEVAE